MIPDGGDRASTSPVQRAAVAGVVLFCLLLAIAPAVGATPIDSTVDTASFQTSDDRLEPNDVPSEATDVGSGDAYDNLSISDSEDVDYFAVDLTEGETVSIDVAFTHADGDIDIAIHERESPLLAVSLSATDNESLEYTADSGGTYYIPVFSYNGETNDYDIDISTSGGTDNSAPTADATADPSTVTVGETVTFNASGSTDADGSIESYEWDVDGDGETDTTGAVNNFSYDSPGTYDAAVTVTDDNGAVDSATVTVTVEEAPNSAPTADATADPSTVTVGETVTFDASGSSDADGSIESYEWDVDGDGETDTTGAVNDFSYDSPGTYDATVTVKDERGATDSATVTVTVEETANSPPSADATADPSTATVGESVTLDASGSTDADGSIESYEWDVDGDGETDTTGAVNDFSYDSPGTYDATVTVKDERGATDSATVTVTIEEQVTVEPGVYEITNVNSGQNLDVSYVSEEPGADVLQYFDNDQANQRFAIEEVASGVYTLTAQHSELVIAVDDGNVVQQTPDGSDRQQWQLRSDTQDGYVFVNAANDDVLSVADGSTDATASVVTASDDGAASQRWTLERIRDVESDNSPPSAEAAADPSTVTVGETVTLDASNSTDSDGSIESYEWDVDGDGETDTTGAVNEVSYDSPGTYDATVTVGDDDGDTNTTTVTITVEETANSPPSAEATADPSTVTVGETVTLDASGSTDADGTVENYEWDVNGDGAPDTTGAVNEFSYDSPGTYDATVTVTDDDGAIGNSTVTVTVTDDSDSLEPNDDQSTATAVGSGDSYDGLAIDDAEDLDFFAVTAEERGTISADLMFSHADGDLDVAVVDGDNNILARSQSVSDDESLTYTPDSGGTYYVAVYGYDGATNSYDIDISTSDPPENNAPSADAAADPSTATVNETVTLDASGSTDADGSIQSYEWDVDGDGDVDTTGAVNDFSYDSPGTYDATVTVTDDDEATDTASVTVTVEERANSPPSADATATPSTALVGESVTLDASSSSDADGSIQSYEWDVDGDGEIDATGAVNDDISYDSPGTYDATVTVTDDSGAIDSATVTVTVTSDDSCDGTGPDADDDGLSDCEEEELGTNPNAADTDGDGLPDGAEVNRNDLLPDADPLRYDIYVEVDYIGQPQLDSEEQQAVVNAYDNENFDNPDGSTGMDLHIIRDEQVSQNSGDPLDPGPYQQSYQESEYECAGYHYAAVGEGLSGTNVVGRGGYGAFTVLQDFNESETFMHELGHSLGLGLGPNSGGQAHGGTYSASRYQSVMNYNWRGSLVFSTGTESAVAHDDWAFLNQDAYAPGWQGDC